MVEALRGQWSGRSAVRCAAAIVLVVLTTALAPVDARSAPAPSPAEAAVPTSARKPGSITVKPRMAEPGAAVRVRGSMATHSRRSVLLQQSIDGRKWSTADKARTNGRGQFAFKTLLPNQAGGTTTYRVITALGSPAEKTRTAVVKVVEPDPNPRPLPGITSTSQVQRRVTLGTEAYFSAFGPAGNGSQVYEFSAITGVTRAVTNLPQNKALDVLIAHAGHVYFSAKSTDPAIAGTWVYDASTGSVRRLDPRETGGGTVVGTEVALRYYGGYLRTDGSPEHTQSVQSAGAPFAGGAKLIAPGTTGDTAYLYSFDGSGAVDVILDKPDTIFSTGLAMGGNYYFSSTAYGAPNSVGNGLWVTDGTAAGTRLIKSLSNVRSMVAAGGLVYFTAGGVDDVFATDGTVVRQVSMPGAAASSLETSTIVQVGQDLWFSASAGEKSQTFKVRAGALDGVPVSTPYLLPISAPTSAGRYLIFNHEEYDDFVDDYVDKIYTFDTTTPVVRATALLKLLPSELSAPKSGNLIIRVDCGGALRPNLGDRVVLRLGSKKLASISLTGNYRALFRVPGRRLGVGRPQLSVQYLGGRTLRPSPLLFVRARITR